MEETLTLVLRSFEQLLRDDLEHGGGRHRENRPHNAVQRRANQQRGNHRHRTHADLLFHDLRHQQMILGLLLRDEEDRDEHGRLRRDGERDQHGRNRGENRPEHRNHLTHGRGISAST